LIAGVGCTSRASASEVVGLLEAALARLGRADLAALATRQSRVQSPALQQAAAHFGVPLVAVPDPALEAQGAAIPNPSDFVAQKTGLSGVAEAAVLFGGALLLPKQKSARATCALGLWTLMPETTP
jgi:cobalt-precorrin 5A hydrolase / precorrin-3B C17-methyltransferase